MAAPNICLALWSLRVLVACPSHASGHGGGRRRSFEEGQEPGTWEADRAAGQSLGKRLSKGMSCGLARVAQGLRQPGKCDGRVGQLVEKLPVPPSDPRASS